MVCADQMLLWFLSPRKRKSTFRIVSKKTESCCGGCWMRNLLASSSLGEDEICKPGEHWNLRHHCQHTKKSCPVLISRVKVDSFCFVLIMTLAVWPRRGQHWQSRDSTPGAEGEGWHWQELTPLDIQELTPMGWGGGGPGVTLTVKN